MAETTDETHPSKPKVHFLLRCFGFSDKVGREKPLVTMELRSGRRNRFISWLRSRMKKSAATVRTVPVDAALPEIAERSGEDCFSSELKKPKPKPKPVVRRHEKPKAPAAEIRVSDSEIAEKSETKTRRSKIDMGQSKIISRMKTHSMRPGSSQPDSSMEKLPSSTRNATLSHSISLSVPTSCHQTRGRKSESRLHVASATAMTTSDLNPSRQQSAWKPSTNSVVKLSDPEQSKSSNKYDPVIGISVIMVTLTVMLLWGRVCAILCTSAMFYFGRRLRSEVELDGGAEEESSDRRSSHLNAEKRKKEVIFEGFLERKNRGGISNAVSGAAM